MAIISFESENIFSSNPLKTNEQKFKSKKTLDKPRRIVEKWHS